MQLITAISESLKLKTLAKVKVYWLVCCLSVCGYFFYSPKLIAEQQLSPQELVEKASLSAYYGGDDGRTMARMKIVDSNGRKQTRQFTILKKDIENGGEQKFLIVFSRPSDVKGTTFMVHKKVNNNDDDRWLYLPALDLVKRISSGDKRTSFVGSHYFYEDISGRSTSDDKHRLLETNEKFYLLEHTPKNPESVEFKKYRTWINKQNFLPTKIEYIDSSDKVYRIIEALEVQNIQGIPTVSKAKITNPLDQSYTLMEFRRMTYNIGIPENLFSERSLRSPPVKWLRSKR